MHSLSVSNILSQCRDPQLIYRSGDYVLEVESLLDTLNTTAINKPNNYKFLGWTPKKDLIWNDKKIYTIIKHWNRLPEKQNCDIGFDVSHLILKYFTGLQYKNLVGQKNINYGILICNWQQKTQKHKVVCIFTCQSSILKLLRGQI